MPVPLSTMVDNKPQKNEKENRKEDEGKNDKSACSVICYGDLFHYRIIGVDKIFICVHFVSGFLQFTINDSVYDSVFSLEHLFWVYDLFGLNGKFLCPYLIGVPFLVKYNLLPELDLVVSFGYLVG